jgi:hypothetical protein
LEVKAPSKKPLEITTLSKKPIYHFLRFVICWFASSGIKARLIVFYGNHRSICPSPIIRKSAMSINLYFTVEVHARIEKMQSKFMAWNEKFTKKMEEHMRIIESFSLPCSAPVSQSFPTTPQPAATITKKRKKRVVKATKIHPCQRQTKSLSTSSRAAHLRCRSINQWTQPSKHVANHRTVSSHAVINPCRAPMPFWSSSHTNSHGSLLWLMRKNSIVFYWFRKRKKNTRTKNLRAPNVQDKSDCGVINCISKLPSFLSILKQRFNG